MKIFVIIPFINSFYFLWEIFTNKSSEKRKIFKCLLLANFISLSTFYIGEEFGGTIGAIVYGAGIFFALTKD